MHWEKRIKNIQKTVALWAQKLWDFLRIGGIGLTQKTTGGRGIKTSPEAEHQKGEDSCSRHLSK